MADEISTEALEAAAQAAATLVERRHHSQLCPVWVNKAEVQWCTCWVLTRARAQATAAAPYLIAEGRRQRDAEVGLCGDRAPGFAGTPALVCDLLAGHEGWHSAENLSDALQPTSRASWGMPGGETTELMARYERELRAKIAAEIRSRAQEFRGVDEAGDAVARWAAALVDGTDQDGPPW